MPIETLASDLAALGGEPTDVLRVKRGNRRPWTVDLARAATNQAGTDHTLAQERARNSQAALNAAAAARDEALAAFPHGVEAALAAAKAALAAASQEQEKVAAELRSLESAIAARKQQAEAAVRDARAARRNMQQASCLKRHKRNTCRRLRITPHRPVCWRDYKGSVTPRISPQPRTGCAARPIGTPRCRSRSGS